MSRLPAPISVWWPPLANPKIFSPSPENKPRTFSLVVTKHPTKVPHLFFLHTSAAGTPEMSSGPKMPISSELSRRGGFSEKCVFSSLHEGRPTRKHVGVEFDTPESHECMGAYIAVLCRREQLSRNWGSQHDGKACRTRLTVGEGFGKTRENRSSLFVWSPTELPSLNSQLPWYSCHCCIILPFPIEWNETALMSCLCGKINLSRLVRTTSTWYRYVCTVQRAQHYCATRTAVLRRSPTLNSTAVDGLTAW